MIKLGSKVRDTVTGFTGTATSRHEYMYGCVRIAVEPLATDGKLGTAETFDEQRLEVITEQDPVISPDSSAKTGGPGDVPAGRFVPAR